MTVDPHYFFSTKILSEDPYLKSFISRALCSNRERFCSFSRYATRLSVEAFFLAALHRAARTKAVNRLGFGSAAGMAQTKMNKDFDRKELKNGHIDSTFHKLHDKMKHKCSKLHH